MIGIGVWDTATCGKDAGATARAIRYAVKIVGIDHVALGSDFDGGTTTPFDASGWPLITEALMNEGFSEEEIRKIMGENTPGADGDAALKWLKSTSLNWLKNTSSRSLKLRQRLVGPVSC